MPRKRRHRRVASEPAATLFMPKDAPGDALHEVVLPVEGLEALRLADVEGLCAVVAAESMGVSRHTFGRVLAQARRTVAEALLGGLALRIAGGSYQLAAPDAPQHEYACPKAATAAAGGETQEDTDMNGQGRRCGQGRGGMGQGRCGMGRGGVEGQGQGQGQGRGQGGQGRGAGRARQPQAASAAGIPAMDAASAPAVTAHGERCPACGEMSSGAYCPACGAAMANRP